MIVKTCVFSISYWDNQKQADLLRNIYTEWQQRISTSLPGSSCFVSTGSYSNPSYNPTKLPLIQLGIEKQLDNNTPRINYFRCGFFGALYYFLLNKNIYNWDSIAFVHYSVLLDIDLTKHIEDFLKQPKSIMAPSLLTQYGNLIETGLMVFKESAIKKWILNKGINDYHSDRKTWTIIEHEATMLFENDWYNPFPEIISIRKYNLPAENEKSTFIKRFELNDYAFLDNPFIFGLEKHCPKYLLDQWKQKHPIRNLC